MIQGEKTHLFRYSLHQKELIERIRSQLNEKPFL